MTCNINPSTLDGFVDNQLSAAQRLELNAHVMQCQQCQQAIALLQQTKAELSALQAPPMSASFDKALNAKLAAIDGENNPSVISLFKRFRIPLQALAASVVLTVAMLSKMMWSYGPADDDFLALDGSIPLIEVGVPKSPNPMLTATTDNSETVVWDDENVDSFDRFTRPDNGFAQYSCGSTVGEKGCNLGPGMQVSSLTISSSI